LAFKNTQLATFGEAFKMLMPLTKLYGVIYVKTLIYILPVEKPRT